MSGCGKKLGNTRYEIRVKRWSPRLNYGIPDRQGQQYLLAGRTGRHGRGGGSRRCFPTWAEAERVAMARVLEMVGEVAEEESVRQKAMAVIQSIKE